MNARIAIFLCALLPLDGLALAQSNGLDAVNDDAVMNELASRGLDTLLERTFDINKISPAERQGRRTLLALSRLGDPNSHLSISQRQKLVNDIVSGIQSALPSINDPNLLMRQAFVLITQGAERDVNTLEYWGENTHTQAELRPIAATIIKILEKCAEQAKAQADAISNNITDPNSPSVAEYEKLDRLANTADYTKNMVAYYLALSIDSASPDRAAVANDALDYLKQFDVPENPDRFIVRNRMAKLAMVKGDYQTARKFFAAVLSDAGNPKPNIAQQYEAKYFSAVTDLLAKNPDAAQKGLDDLLAWQQANLPNDKQARDGAEAASAMLKYRILSLQSDQAKSAEEKKHFNDAAVAVLIDLVSKRPELRAIIYDQLLPKLDEHMDLKQVEPLLLRAVISKGEQELQKPNEEQADAKILQRAIDAAHEVVRRQGQSDVDEQMVDASALLIPFFLQKLDRKAEAAGAFVDFAEQYKQTDLKDATLALDNAQSLIGELRADVASRDEITKTYERFLPLAIGEPFDRKEFAFEYARRLELNDHPADAVRYFHLVPADDKRALDAQFQELVATKQQLDDEPANSTNRAQLLAQIQTLAAAVTDSIRHAMIQSTDNSQRDHERSMQISASLLAADLARREQNDPQQAIELLTNFEAAVVGLPNADNLVNEAMYIRVQSYMAMQKYDDATRELVRLLNKTEGGQGAQIVYNLLEKLNADFDRAQQAGDRAAMKTLAKSRAQLSGFLVKWAAENKDPNISKFTYRYRVFDADTQRRAAELEDDSAAREAGLKIAMQRYQALQSPENLALYKASLDAKAAADSSAYDPQVTFGIALVEFDLGNFQQSADAFGQLLSERKLGAAVNTVDENGQETVIDNDRYWEAVLKLIQGNMKLGKNLDDAKSYLKSQYITWGDRVGGKKWKGQFEALRGELIPEFKVGATTRE
jgi:hypothetical protein